MRAPRIVALPGVYRPRSDTALLREALAGLSQRGPRRWLDVCTGTGALALAAHGLGAPDVTAVDIAPRAVRNTRLNALLNRARLRVLRGDLFAPVTGERFDAIVANPPYVPTPHGSRRTRGSEAWDAGPDGRLVLDRFCTEAADRLNPSGVVLLVQSSLADPARSAAMLAAGGLRVREAGRHDGPLGPIAAAREDFLRRTDRLPEEGAARESLVVLWAERPGPDRP
ncbi:MAG: methyltransferase [Solirubrobacterales bacterium]|nr:methyltransferase [Solirubrobacterales bacterium]